MSRRGSKIEGRNKNSDMNRAAKAMFKEYGVKPAVIIADLGKDNSYYILPKSIKRLKKQLEHPNPARRLMEKIFPKKQKQRENLLQHLKKLKNTDDGVVLVGLGKKFGNNPTVLAHEIGHASNHKDREYLKTVRRFMPAVSGLAGTYLTIKGKPVTGSVLMAAGHIPALIDEYMASHKAYKGLKKANEEPETWRLAAGLGTYLVLPATHIGLTIAKHKKKNKFVL